MILLILSIISAAIGKSIMDTLQFHYENSIFIKNQTWWNPKISWKHKYKNDDYTQGPAFWGSTTYLVFLTDGWHFFQFIFLNSLFIAITFGDPFQFFNNFWDYIFTFLICRILFGVIFELTFRLFSEKKKL